MTTTTRLAPLLAALTLAACGGDDPAPRAAAGNDAAFEGALAFAKCMRENGVDFPDPQRSANGMVRIGGPGVDLDPQDPKVRAAHEACQHHMREGAGEAPSPEQQAEVRDASVRYARCMREQGIDVPDPKAGTGGGIVMERGGDGPDPESPAFKAAHDRCDDHLADIEGRLRQEGSR